MLSKQLPHANAKVTDNVLAGKQVRRERRGRVDVTLADLAKALGVSVPQMSRLENGVATWTQEHWDAARDFLSAVE